MVDVEIKNLDQVIAQVEKWEADVYELTRQVAIGFSVRLFNGVLVRSAQYSGDYAANWKYSVGAPDYTFDAGVLQQRDSPLVGDYGRIKGNDPHRKMGDGEAVAHAQAAARGRSADFALGETIYISNSAAHDEPYAWLIEEGKIKFRPGNIGHTVQRTVDYMMQYTVIDNQAAQLLRRERL